MNVKCVPSPPRQVVPRPPLVCRGGDGVAVGGGRGVGAGDAEGQRDGAVGTRRAERHQHALLHLAGVPLVSTASSPTTLLPVSYMYVCVCVCGLMCLPMTPSVTMCDAFHLATAATTNSFCRDLSSNWLAPRS